MLKSALILGSGFHRHVFGDGVERGERACLVDWHTLVTRTVQEMQVAVPSMAQSPVLQWESMIIRAARDGYRDNGVWKFAGDTTGGREHEETEGGNRGGATHRIEMCARRVAAGLLKKQGAAIPFPYAPGFPQTGGGGVLFP